MIKIKLYFAFNGIAFSGIAFNGIAVHGIAVNETAFNEIVFYEIVLTKLLQFLVKSPKQFLFTTSIINNIAVFPVLSILL